MKVQFTLSIGYPGASRKEIVEVDIEDLEGEALQKALDEEWDVWAWNYISGGAEVVE